MMAQLTDWWRGRSQREQILQVGASGQPGVVARIGADVGAGRAGQQAEGTQGQAGAQGGAMGASVHGQSPCRCGVGAAMRLKKGRGVPEGGAGAAARGSGPAGGSVTASRFRGHHQPVAGRAARTLRAVASWGLPIDFVWTDSLM